LLVTAAEKDARGRIMDWRRSERERLIEARLRVPVSARRPKSMM
jgi:hypothetical protein